MVWADEWEEAASGTDENVPSVPGFPPGFQNAWGIEVMSHFPLVLDLAVEVYVHRFTSDLLILPIPRSSAGLRYV